MPILLSDAMGGSLEYGCWLIFLNRSGYVDGANESAIYLIRSNNSYVSDKLTIIEGKGTAAAFLTDDFRINVKNNTNKQQVSLTAVKVGILS